ncbi:hypothetical protein BCR44DRAFT_1438475 [Catenaria anguillulae PL171]|uniref:Yeast cell wall synthesis Kre9/Knh1-like N-terminal domain-containing protein n=1 Tax=Catenaria anguillulae PL171 TaxID=765915 RepID=A0A1Y2HFV9_9FUNG|nr:hypothetical protein BCR44DRAFT_1438475 [Catenaria anguillulae PL171]
MTPSLASVALLGLALVALAANATQVTLNTPNGPWRAGSTVTLTWSVDQNAQGVPDGTLGKIVLMKVNGNVNNMTPVAEIFSSVRPEAGTQQWQVPQTIVNGDDYALKWEWIGQPTSTFRYSAVFPVTGGSGQQSNFINTATTTTGSATAASATTTTTATRSTTTITVTATRQTATPSATASPKDSGALVGVQVGISAAAAAAAVPVAVLAMM